MLKTLACTLALATGLALAAADPAQLAWRPSADMEAGMAQAIALYRSQQFAGAYGRFVRLADLGYPQAAYLALSMYRDGKLLYGTDWYASPLQIEAWVAIVAEDSRQVVAQVGD